MLPPRRSPTRRTSATPTSPPAVTAACRMRRPRNRATPVQKAQPVGVEVHMFPGQAVHGHGDSLAPASGQEFALLPPDNATGNFTKVVQRIPVKIALEGGASIDLRPGMSVIQTIETRARA